MDPDRASALRFEDHRAHLRAVATRMLGSPSEADDAVQETWIRFARTDTSDVVNLGGWLTTVVARVCLDLLRTRAARREDPQGVHVPDPLVGPAEGSGPEEDALLADSVGVALLVVLDTLSPAERLAFVLHDVFAVPFDQIAQVLERSPDAAKQLASRARRRVRDPAASREPDLARQRRVVDAFLAAARGGDIAGLLAVLDPDVVLRADAGAGPLGPSQRVGGAHAVAAQAVRFAGLAGSARPVLVNGRPGLVAAPGGTPVSVLGVVIADGRITRIDILADPERVSRLDLSFLAG